jgi:very-short-patch-repair endonuclease
VSIQKLHFPLPWREGIKGRGRKKDRMTNRLSKLAKTLRKGSTDAEMLLWQRLKARQMEGIKFRRQQPIEQFIVDFVSFEKRIIIELDGGQHAVSKGKDYERDKFFSESGFRVLRFWNNEVFENISGVLDKIRETCLR